MRDAHLAPFINHRAQLISFGALRGPRQQAKLRRELLRAFDLGEVTADLRYVDAAD